jgi:hypothetical protein
MKLSNKEIKEQDNAEDPNGMVHIIRKLLEDAKLRREVRQRQVLQRY